MSIQATLTYIAAGLIKKPDNMSDQKLDSTSVTNMVNVVLMFAFFVAVVVIIIAGISYSTSAGDASKMAKAKNTIIFSLVGIAVILLSSTILGFIIEAVW